MRLFRNACVAFLAVSSLIHAAPAAKPFTVPVTYFKLPNGLKVVFSKDTVSPVVTVAVYYNIGFRIEPKNRTGFAHLFEHMMFQGSNNLPKGEFDKVISGNGGTNNGSTRFDFTNYYETVPTHTLEAVLWAEADRMKGLLLTPENLKNQQGVVSNEVKVNVLNQPYGGFPWLDMPQYANKNWYNAHNFYGELSDLEAATLDDVKDFFRLYYAPNNAVLAVVGDFDEAQARKWVEKYFTAIPAAKRPPTADLTEPRQEAEQRFNKVDKLAARPAFALAYHTPEAMSKDHFAFVLLQTILADGNDSLLYQELVKKRGYTSFVQGSMNFLGNEFNYNGPMLWTSNLIHDASVTTDQIVEAYDTVISQVQEKGVSQEQLNRALVKYRAGWYRNLSNGEGKADMLAVFALFHDKPERVNEIEASLAAVTPAQVQAVAKEYLRKTNRTILTIEPGAAQKGSR